MINKLIFFLVFFISNIVLAGEVSCINKEALKNINEVYRNEVDSWVRDLGGINIVENSIANFATSMSKGTGAEGEYIPFEGSYETVKYNTFDIVEKERKK